MFDFSFEYFDMLTEEEYLCFLKWPDFVCQRYHLNAMNDADSLVECLAYEWLINEAYFDQRYIDELVKLIHINTQHHDLLQNESYGLAFSLTSIISALCICLLLREAKVELTHPLLTKENISRFVRNETTKIEDFNNKLRKLCEQYEQQAPEFSPVISSQLNLAVKKIMEVAQVVSIIHNYLNRLECVGTETASTRLGILKKLYFEVLLPELRLTDEVQQKIATCVYELRRQSPEPWEEAEFLNTLSPPSAIGGWLSRFVKLGMGLFAASSISVDKDNEKKLSHECEKLG